MFWIHQALARLQKTIKYDCWIYFDLSPDGLALRVTVKWISDGEAYNYRQEWSLADLADSKGDASKLEQFACIVRQKMEEVIGVMV